jgi:hypothetical protein
MIVVAAGVPAAAEAQVTAFKGGVMVSRLQTTAAADYWDEQLVATTFGGHVRFGFGPLLLQPEILVGTKGAGASTAPEDEQIRIEYIEVPLLLIVPVRIGDLEPFGFGGPSIMLESRCRWMVREQGLRSTTNCEPRPPGSAVFTRTVFDFGLVAGGGASYPIGGGRVLLEGRHTWGLRDIHTGPGEAEVRNRSFSVMIGYSLGWEPGGN